MRKYFFLACVFFCFSLQAKKAPVREFADFEKGALEAPWLTGPLLAPSGLTMPPGRYDIEPSFFFIANTGQYNAHWESVERETFWNNYFQPQIQFGLTSWMDFQFIPTLIYNYTEGAGKWGVGDMPIIFGVQLYKGGGNITDWIPDLKLALKELIPIGKYQNLNPQKLNTDMMGEGSWQTALALVWGNLFYLGKGHFLTARIAFQYVLPAPTHVKNLNAYGGGPGTDGTVYPAESFNFDIGMELTLTQSWVFALDIVGDWSGRTRFKGETTVSNTSPASTQFSLAPAIEYNWNANLGIIFGPWFTVAGRNAGKFTSGLFSLNYYH